MATRQSGKARRKRTGCIGKVKYWAEAPARDRCPAGQRVYKCEFCPAWHHGHARGDELSPRELALVDAGVEATRALAQHAGRNHLAWCWWAFWYDLGAITQVGRLRRVVADFLDLRRAMIEQGGDCEPLSPEMIRGFANMQHEIVSGALEALALTAFQGSATGGNRFRSGVSDD